jgi:hypothetical protein
MAPHCFTGPLFLVGRPRSGTKLLRTLLNQHPAVSIPVHETHFIVPMVKRFGLSPNLQDARRYQRFFRALAGSSFYHVMQAEGLTLAVDYLPRVADLNAWPSICEAILKFYGPAGPDHEGVWGDKTPGYLKQIGYLARAFPGARFIHIVRDPRDCCLSTHKVWGRSILLVAELWRRDIERARVAGRGLGERYYEVHFETLLSRSADTLQQICAFIGIDYRPEMMELSTPAENLGDAAGHRQIVASNQRKYLAQLPEATVRRIEEIVYPVATQLGYAPVFATGFRPLHRAEALWLTLYDRFAWTRFHMDEKGVRQGLAFLSRSL